MKMSPQNCVSFKVLLHMEIHFSTGRGGRKSALSFTFPLSKSQGSIPVYYIENHIFSTPSFGDHIFSPLHIFAIV